MTLLDDTRFIEAPEFFPGQRLFAADLRDLHAFNREMRWLHNASLHQAGIGNGFAVTGAKGDREIGIGAGYAIDARGREIVLTGAVTTPVPPVAGDERGGSAFYDVAIAYAAADQLEEVETRDGVCFPRGAVRLREEPRICWLRLEADELGNLRATDPRAAQDLAEGLTIVLARAEVRDCQLERVLSIGERRSARPATQPYIAAGIELNPSWQINRVSDEVILMHAVVNTEVGEFGSRPTYWARTDGNQLVDLDGRLVPLISMLQVLQADERTFSVLVVAWVTFGGSAAMAVAEKTLAQWRVVWFGVEN